MKKIITLTALVVLSLVKAQEANSMQTIYDFTVEDINGETFNFADLKGKKILIVNTASKCGFTPQFEGLEELYQTYKEENFVVIGFPSNDFASQDPGSNEEIATFCKINYGVTFPMMAKIKVTGKEKAPIYEFLTQKTLNGQSNSSVKWNFQKYLINEDGTLHNYFYSVTKPMSKKITKWIEKK